MGFMFYIWIMVMVIAIIIEISTTDLTSFWFAFGGLAALISNLFLHNSYIPIQVSIFTVVSIICILTLRPIIKKKLSNDKIATNIDSLIGKKVIVLQQITPTENGVVKADGIEWNAICKEQSIEPGDFVIIESVSGNTLMVRKEEREENEND